MHFLTFQNSNHTLHNRFLVPARVVLCLALIFLATTRVIAADDPEFVLFSPRVSVGDLQRVKVVIELTGDLKVPGQADQSHDVPVRMNATLLYDEKITGVGSGTGYGSASVRHYSKAAASIEYSSDTLQPVLRDDRRIVAVANQGPKSGDSRNTSATKARDSRLVVFSPLGPLTRDELDLLNVPVSSLLVDALLPDRAITKGGSWDLNCPQLATLLGLDAVNKSDLRCTFDRIEGNSAIVHIKGRVSGAAEGVASEIRLAAKYAFDTKRNRIAWFAMSFNDQRSPGHAQPGSNVTVRLQMAMLPLSDIPTLNDDVLADLAFEADDAQRLLELTSERAGFQLLSNRSWHLITQRPDVTVLRLIDRGDLLAQCNLSTLPPLAEGKSFGMVEFQEDVKRALDENMGKFITASESRTDDGVHVMRVVAAGDASDVAIQWIYYHLTNQQGRRASCVFTLETDLVDRFGVADQALVSSFRFVDPRPFEPSATAEPETADQSSVEGAAERR